MNNLCSSKIKKWKDKLKSDRRYLQHLLKKRGYSSFSKQKKNKQKMSKISEAFNRRGNIYDQ